MERFVILKSWQFITPIFQSSVTQSLHKLYQLHRDYLDKHNSVGNSPVTGEFPAQKASNAENVSSWWRHHGVTCEL